MQTLLLISQETIQPIYFESLQDEYVIDENLYILEDAACKIDFEESILKSSKSSFQTFDGTERLSLKSCHWVHFKIKSAAGFNHYFKDWKLSIGEADFATVYIVDYQGKVIEYKKFGKWYPSSEKQAELNFKSQRINLNFDPSEELSFYIKYQKKDHHKHVIDIRFHKYDLFQTSSYLFGAWQDWLFLGFLLTMILLNFLFFYGTKYKAYYYHGLFIFGLSIFLLDLYGVTLNLPIIREYPFMVQFIDMLGIAIADIAYFQFVRYYLNLNQILPFWNKILHTIVQIKFIFWPLSIAFYYLTYNEPFTDKLILVFLLLEYSIIIYFLIFRLKPKEKAAMYLIIGSAFLVVLLLIDTLSLFNSVGISKALSQIGIMGEIITFSFGLSYRVKLLKDEEEKAEKIKELSAFKSKLLTNITHEFRTPLTIIQGVSELFQESLQNKVSPEEIKSGYDAIQRNSKNLLELVNQMLDLAKLESKTLQLEMSNTDVIGLINSVINSLKSESDKKNISLYFEKPMQALDMSMDAQKVQTVLVNLISNAIKFTPNFGQIKVALNTEENEGENIASIKVSDTGIGIAEKDLPHVFDRFYQPETKNQQNVGTGIGLSLVKELISLMTGTVSVSSELDKGTTFNIELPIIAEATAPTTPENNLSALPSIDDDPFELLDQKPVLLIVEDNHDIVDYLERLLSKDYTLAKAFDGQEGLEKANSIIPDLIISDLMMPKLDGLQLCEKLKSDDKTNHIPIVILTAKSSFEHKIEGLNTGADAYLTKPFRKEELFIRLKKLNESRQLLQEKFSQFTLIEKPKKLKQENSFLHKIHAVIEDNLTNSQFSVEMLAKLMFMSRMQLHRKLKATSDRTTSNYIRSYRLYKSKPTLSDASMSISEIAWSVGFQDVNYYSKSFQKEFDMSPSEYRAMLSSK